MNDEELRLMAGQAIGLDDVDMRFFNPLQSESQSLFVAKVLKLNIHINLFANRTEITKIDGTGKLHTLLVVSHDVHGDDISLAMRYAVLRAIPAALLFVVPLEQACQHLITASTKQPSKPPAKQQSLKHGLRVGKARESVTA
jgi:hypothetical protein